MAKKKTGPKPQHTTALALAIEASGHKPEYVAALSGVPIGSVQGYISGNHEPKVSAAIRLSRFLKRPIEELFPIPMAKTAQNRKRK